MSPVKRVRGYSELPDLTASDIAGQLASKDERLRRRLAHVSHVVAIASGKGGVGKSVITANLAVCLARSGYSVGVVDADLNGPSMARLLGTESTPPRMSEDSVQPAVGAGGVKLMSMDLLLANAETPLDWKGPKTESFLWRGTMEANTLREFISDTDWGALDFLILDLPPGSDRIAPVRDLLPELGGVVLITLPSDISRFVVGKALTMVRKLDVAVIGYVENMAGYLCPHCGEKGRLFRSEKREFENTPRLATLPFDPSFGRETEAGRPGVMRSPDSEVGLGIGAITRAVIEHFEGEEG